MIHPSAIIGTDVEIGIGTAVMAGVIVNCYTTIGKRMHYQHWINNDHDNSRRLCSHFTRVHKLVRLSWKGTWLGVGSVVSNNLTSPVVAKLVQVLWWLGYY